LRVLPVGVTVGFWRSIELVNVPGSSFQVMS